MKNLASDNRRASDSLRMTADTLILLGAGGCGSGAQMSQPIRNTANGILEAVKRTTSCIEGVRRVLNLFDAPGSGADQCRTIGDFLKGFSCDERPRDLLVIFVGHGLIDREDHYFLGNYEADSDCLSPSAISPRMLFDTLWSSAPAARIHVIVDACYASRLADDFKSQYESANRAPNSSPEAVSILASSARGDQSSAMPDCKYTSFGEALISILMNGDPNRGRYFTLRDIHRLVHNSFVSEQAAAIVGSIGVRENVPRHLPKLEDPYTPTGIAASDCSLFANVAHPDVRARGDSNVLDNVVRLAGQGDLEGLRSYLSLRTEGEIEYVIGSLKATKSSRLNHVRSALMEHNAETVRALTDNEITTCCNDDWNEVREDCLQAAEQKPLNSLPTLVEFAKTVSASERTIDLYEEVSAIIDRRDRQLGNQLRAIVDDKRFDLAFEEMRRPESWDRLRVDNISKCGRGRMTYAFVGVDRHSGRKVVIRLLKPRFRDKAVRRSFLDRAKSLSAIDRRNRIDVVPNVVAGQPAIVREVHEGKPLTDRFPNSQPQSILTVACICARLASALREMEKHEFFHGGIRPTNVFLTETETDIYIVAPGDENLALAVSGRPITSIGLLPEELNEALETAAPEVYEGKATPVSDQYSIGCVAFWLATGRLLFGELPEGVKRQLAHQTHPVPTPSSVGSQLGPKADNLICRLLSKSPEDRFASMEDVELAFWDLLRGPENGPKGESGDGPHGGQPLDSPNDEDDTTVGQRFVRIREDWKLICRETMKKILKNLSSPRFGAGPCGDWYSHAVLAYQSRTSDPLCCEGESVEELQRCETREPFSPGVVRNKAFPDALMNSSFVTLLAVNPFGPAALDNTQTLLQSPNAWFSNLQHGDRFGLPASLDSWVHRLWSRLRGIPSREDLRRLTYRRHRTKERSSARVEILEDRMLLTAPPYALADEWGVTDVDATDPDEPSGFTYVNDEGWAFFRISHDDEISIVNEPLVIIIAGNAITGNGDKAPAEMSWNVTVVDSTTGDQRTWPLSPKSVAMDADGDFVVTWTSVGQDGKDYGIFSQKYSANGTRLGSEFQVNSFTTGRQYYSTVAMSAAGDFVVTWTNASGEDGNDAGVFSQRFDSTGVPQGTEFRVNTFTTNSQAHSSIAMNVSGDFVITWTSVGQDGEDSGIYAQRYSTAGIAVGTEFRVNTTTARNQILSSVAMDSDGDFVITWTSYHGSSQGIYAQRYNAAGVPQGSELRVNSAANGPNFSTVAMDSDGDFVVTWSADEFGTGIGVYAQRYNATGMPLGTEFRVNSFTTSLQGYSTVAMDADGDFVVSWVSYDQDGGLRGIFAQAYSANGLPRGSEFRVNSFAITDQSFSTVAMDADGDFVVTWTSDDQDGSGRGIYAQRYTFISPDDADDAGPIVTDLIVAGDALHIGEQLITPPTAITVLFSENLSTTGGVSGVSSVTNPSNWGLTRNGVDISSQISSITFGLNGTTGKFEAVVTFTAPLDYGDFVLIAKHSITDTFGNPLDGDQNGTPGADFTRAIRIRCPHPIGDEFRVNTFTTADQLTWPDSRSVAMDADGNFVVVWSSYSQDGNMWEVYSQRYNATGVPQGSEFRVNSYTTNSQWHPAVAMDADGDFVVTWSSVSQDGDDFGIFGQRFNSAGVAQGSEFRVNSFTTNFQHYSTVAMDADGDFVVTWTSNGQDGSSYGVYAQRYNASGTPQGSEFRLNTYTTSDQVWSTVAMSADGNFVVTWTSNEQDGYLWGVFARLYDAVGVPQGSEFVVNSLTTDLQQHSSVAMDASGDFVVTWSSRVVDSGSDRIFAQRYNATGLPLGSEFRVSSFTTIGQTGSSVAMDADGDFVVTWTSFGQDGSMWGIYAQRFDASGAPSGTEFRVNSFTTSLQVHSTVAMDADGDFVITWSSAFQDGSGYGVYAQIYRGGNVSTDIALSPSSVAENAGINTIVGTFTTTDADSPETFTYALVSGSGDTGNASFNILGNQLRTSASFNFEAQTSYSIRVQVTDAGGLTFEKALTVNVSDVNEFVPVITSHGGGPTANVNVAEGNQAVSTVTATDGDGSATLSFSISGGDDASRFSINSSTGALTFNIPPNFELPLSDGTLVDVQDLAVTVTNVNEPVAHTSHSGADVVPLTQSENLITVSLITAFDPDAGTVFTYSLSGPDASRFTISHLGDEAYVLGFAVAPNFEAPTDAGGDNIYNVTVTVSDGAGSSDTREFIVTITDANDRPDITSNGGAATASISVAENQTAVTTVTATDEDLPAQPLTYSISGGADAALFSINSATGVLTFVSAPNFEAPIGGDNSYGVTVQASYGILVEVQAITVTVTNVNEAPLITSDGGGATAAIVLAENTALVTTVLASDPDSGTILQYTLSGTDAARFVITTAGVLRFVALPNFEAPADADGNNVYHVTVTVSDGSLTDSQQIAVAITDVAESLMSVGSEIRVNTHTVSNQYTLPDSGRAVAMDPDGDFIVTWTSDGQDGGGAGVYAQKFRAVGTPVGLEFRVNAFTSGSQSHSTVATDVHGNFVITWSSFGQDGEGYGIYARRYSAAGIPSGSEFRVNSYTSSHQRWSMPAMEANGDFVVTWASFVQDGASSGYGIYAQRYRADGTPVGSEFHVNTHTTSQQRMASVAMDADGDFVVTWASYLQDGSQYGVYSQRFDKTGVAQGSEFRVSRFTTNQQHFPSVAMDAEGDFVVVWDSLLQDGNAYGTYAQRYDAVGVPQGSEFRVNASAANNQFGPTVTMDSDGDFVVAWTGNTFDGSSFGYGIYARRFNAAGTPLGNEQQINSVVSGTHQYAIIAGDADGDLAIVWTGQNQDGSGDGVYLQRLAKPATDDADNAGPMVTDLVVAGDTLYVGEQLVSPPGAIDHLGIVTYNYDCMGRLLDVGCGDGNLIEYTYDSFGNIISIHELGGWQHFAYDVRGRLTFVTSSPTANPNDPDAVTIEYEYDLANRMTAIVYPNGNRTRYRYDETNGLTSAIAVVSDDYGLVTSFEYLLAGSSRLTVPYRTELESPYIRYLQADPVQSTLAATDHLWENFKDWLFGRFVSVPLLGRDGEPRLVVKLQTSSDPELGDYQQSVDDSISTANPWHGGRYCVNEYSIIRPLGRGGFGDIWLAWDRKGARTAALKVCRFEDNPAVCEAQASACEALLRLHHRSIVKLYDAWFSNGAAYIVMEYVAGQTLEDIIRREGPLPHRRTAMLMNQLLEAVCAMHGAGIVHRDLKPANIMVMDTGTDDERPVVIDFDLASHEKGESSVFGRTRKRWGTTPYLDVRQDGRRSSGFGRDLFSLGVVLWRMSTGLPALELPSTLVELQQQLCNSRENSTSATAPILCDIIWKAINDRACERFQSAEKFLAALQRLGPRSFVPAFNKGETNGTRPMQ